MASPRLSSAAPCLSCTLLGLTAALVSPLAGAQTTIPAFELERLTPNLTSPHSVALSTGDTLELGGLRVSLLGHYEHDALVFYRGRERLGAAVAGRFTTVLGASYGLLDWLEVGLQLPIVISQWGDDLSSVGISPVPRTVLGAPVLHGALALAREREGAMVDLSVSLGVSLPVGSADGLTLDPGSGVALAPRLGAGRTFGGFLRVGAELGAVIRGTQRLSRFSTAIQDEVGSLLQYGVNVSTLGDGLRGELLLRGLTPFSRTPGAAELLAVARYPVLERRLEIFLAAGPGIGEMPGVPLFRVLGGLTWTPIEPQRCVEERPYGLSECPALDRDRDGVMNAADRCPEVSGPAKLDGCPLADADGDGVPDTDDKCPAQPGPADTAGCPLADADGDGVPDADDKCPAQFGDADTAGCPPLPDTDGDGVSDADDKCPAEKGAPGGDGCPPRSMAPPEEPDKGAEDLVLETSKTAFFETIYFELNKADISERSYEQLSKVATTLKEHPEIKKVRVEGHTDTTGPEVFNRYLSQQRADAVMRFLVERGVAEARLEAKGYGPDRPVADNADFGGRIKNRRTEFVVIE